MRLAQVVITWCFVALAVESSPQQIASQASDSTARQSSPGHIPLSWARDLSQLSVEQQYLAGGPDYDYSYAFKVFAEKAEKGDADAKYNLAVAYLRGIGVQKNAVTGLDWLRKAADQNHIRALHYLGYVYLMGESVPKDFAAAYKWFTIAGAAGYDDSNTEAVGALLTEAQSKKSQQEALEWYRAHPAVAGFARALGFAYYSGEGVERERQQAAQWFLRAAQAGDVMSARILAPMYEEGVDVKKDERAAVKWYRLAVEGGVHGALNGLAWLEATSEDPAVRNTAEALDFAKKAVAEEKRPEYLDTLAEAYFVNGQVEKAIEAEREALALRPEDPAQYQKQLNKFLKARNGAER